MDWTAAIERNRTALLAVAAAIVAVIGGREGGAVARHLRNAALALLRPAESAVRRLIIMAARGLAVTHRPSRPMLQRPVRRATASDRTPAFRLVDPAPRLAPLRIVRPNGVPRIRTFWGPAFATTLPAVPAPLAIPARLDPGATVDMRRLRLRLAALETALADLPRQARRLARLRARWTFRPVTPGALPRVPLRFGHPPGHSRKPCRTIDTVLRDCHALALESWARDAVSLTPQRRDTS